MYFGLHAQFFLYSKCYIIEKPRAMQMWSIGDIWVTYRKHDTTIS